MRHLLNDTSYVIRRLERTAVFTCLAVLPAGLIDPAFAAEQAGKEGSATGGMPQFDPTWFVSQIFWLAVFFFIMYAFFSRKTLPDISGVIKDRQERIKSDMETAERQTAEARSVQKSYEESLQNARDESSKILKEAEDGIKQKTAREMSEFRKRADEKISQTEERIQKAQDDIMDDMNEIAAEITKEAAEKIVGISTDPKNTKSVIEDLSKKAQRAA